MRKMNSMEWGPSETVRSSQPVAGSVCSLRKHGSPKPEGLCGGSGWALGRKGEDHMGSRQRLGF